MKKRKIKYLIMEHIGIRVTTYCNLNCKDCADLVPYQKSCHYDYNLLIEDISKVLSAVDFIQEILLGGGEIFLYPHMDAVLKYCIGQNKLGKVIIVTNGTMMPSETTLELLKNDKVTVRVSGYGEDIVPKRAALIQLLEKENIHVHNLEGMIWKNVGNMECRNRTRKEMEEIWDKCSMNVCETLTSRGRIYYCSRAIAADELDCCPAPGENEYIDVRNTPVEELGDKLEKFYELEYISTCNYCDGITDQSPIVPTAAQMVRKDLVMELYIQERKLMRENNDREILLSWLEIVNQNYKHLIYESEFKEVLETTLDAYENTDVTNSLDTEVKHSVLLLWNKFHNHLFERYNFCVWDSTQTLKEQIRHQDDIGKNTIYILVKNPGSKEDDKIQRADFIVTLNDMKEEMMLEKETGCRSIFRNAFIFGSN